MTRRRSVIGAVWTLAVVATATVGLYWVTAFMASLHDARGRGEAGERAVGERSAEGMSPVDLPLPRDVSRATAPVLEPAAPEPVGPPPGADGPSVSREAEEGLLSADPPAAVIEALRDRRLTIPVQGVTADALVPSFAEPRGTRSHEALDIMAPAGTPVLAVEDGMVARLFTSEAGGLTIYQFDPSRSVAYYYAHLQGYAPGVADGDVVTRGQVIGYVGSTGNADAAAPHLHFAIFRLGPERRWWEGMAIDPFLVWR